LIDSLDHYEKYELYLSYVKYLIDSSYAANVLVRIHEVIALPPVLNGLNESVDAAKVLLTRVLLTFHQ
jgi:hypothetical protein